LEEYEFDCAIAMFDVINYIQDKTGGKDLPIKQGATLYLIYGFKEGRSRGFSNK
jgi:hypothetical protein